MFRSLTRICFLATLFCLLAPSFAAPAEQAPVLITNPALRVRIAMATPVGNAAPAAKVQQFIEEDLGFLPFVTMINPRTVPGGVTQNVASGDSLDLRRFQLAGAHMLITAAWFSDGAKPRVELRVFDVATGTFVFGSSYSGADDAAAGDVADKFCSDLMKAITGRGEFFRSTIAFVKSDGPNKKDIWAVRPTGRNLRRLTNLPGDALSPSWSPDGRFVIFSHVDKRSHALGVWDSATHAVQRIRFPGNTVIGPCFMPDNKVAVSLSTGKNPSIFLLNHQFQRERALVDSSSIDVSPSVDATGTKLAFVSSRMGNPHIFLKDLRTGAVTRITYDGKYNTEPSISPDGTLIVFSRMMGGGHKIFVHDLLRNTENQLTVGPGSDEQPAFAPDSYFIAFASNRGGTRQLYLTTRNGGEPKRIPTGNGDAAFPDWGLFPK